MILAGIDPGISPAIFIHSFPDDGKYILCRIPEENHSFNPWKLRKLLLSNKVQAVCTELVNAISGQGLVSSCRFLRNADLAVGVAIGLGIPVMHVTPSKWKREILADYDLGDDAPPEKRKKIQKQAACSFVHDHFPNLSLKPTSRHRVDDIDLADAVCLGVYGIRHREDFE